jgi:hypothetical protein
MNFWKNFRHRATAPPRRAERWIFFTAHPVARTFKPSRHPSVFANRTVGISFRISDRSNRPAESPSRTADAFIGMADAANRTVGSASHTADAYNHTAGSINRTADSANRPADHSTTRLDDLSAPINHLSMRLNRPAAPVNRPAARFFAKNTPKLAKTTSFPRPAASAAQKATVVAFGLWPNRSSHRLDATPLGYRCQSPQ